MANNKIQVKRTNVSGRSANVTSSGNGQYIDAGELALNMADGILYTSNGSALITVGANQVNQRITNSLTIDNNKNLRFTTVNTSAAVSLIQQNDDNFVFYSTNTAYGQRAVFSVYANSITSNLQIQIPLQLNAGLVANNTTGTAGQVLTTNGTTTYWSTVSGGGGGSVNVDAQYTWTNTQTFNANISYGNNIALATNTAVYFNSIADANWRIGRNTGGTSKFFYTGNTIDIIAANSATEGIAFGFTGNSYLETGYAGTFTRFPLYVGNSTQNIASTNTTILIQANTTINSTHTASLVQVANSTSTANITASSLNIYANSTVNGSITNSLVQVANSTGNVQHTATSVTVQNSTVNTVMGLQSVVIQSNSTVNGSITNSLIQIANSSGNVQINPLTITTRTNTTVNSTVNSTALLVANSTGNVQITAAAVLARTGTSNTNINATMVSVTNSTINTQLTSSSLKIFAAGTPTINAEFSGRGVYAIEGNSYWQVQTSTNDGVSGYFQHYKNFLQTSYYLDRIVATNTTAFYDISSSTNNVITKNIGMELNDTNDSWFYASSNSSGNSSFSQLTPTSLRLGNTSVNLVVNSTTIETGGDELVLRETGDYYGAVSLKLQNRNGVNGARFVQENASINLVDFIFTPNTTIDRNIRMEARSAYVFNGNSEPEFQFGIAGDPTFTVADSMVVMRRALSANGSLGSSGDVLTSNGTAVYWSPVAAGVNVDAQYTWTNTHTFQNNITFGNSSVNVTVNNSYLGFYSGNSDAYNVDLRSASNTGFNPRTIGILESSIDPTFSGITLSRLDITNTYFTRENYVDQGADINYSFISILSANQSMGSGNSTFNKAITVVDELVGNTSTTYSKQESNGTATWMQATVISDQEIKIAPYSDTNNYGVLNANQYTFFANASNFRIGNTTINAVTNSAGYSIYGNNDLVAKFYYETGNGLGTINIGPANPANNDKTTYITKEYVDTYTFINSDIGHYQGVSMSNLPSDHKLQVYDSNSSFIEAQDFGYNYILYQKGAYGSANTIRIEYPNTFSNQVITLPSAGPTNNGQALFTNSTGYTYWANVVASGVNTDSQYTWTNTQTFENTITFSTSANAITLTNTTSNWIYWEQSGYAPPSVNTRSSGTKLVLYPGVNPSAVDYAIGIDAATMWFSLTNIDGNKKFKWYAGTTELATLKDNGDFLTTGKVNADSYTIGSFVVANSTVVNATHLAGVDATSYVTNTDSRTLSGNLIFTANVTLGGVIANGTLGTSGQVLTSNGTKVYWAPASVNVDSQYTWTNTQTFQNNITFSANLNVGNSTSNTTTSFGGVYLRNSTTETQLTPDRLQVGYIGSIGGSAYYSMLQSTGATFAYGSEFATANYLGLNVENGNPSFGPYTGTNISRTKISMSSAGSGQAAADYFTANSSGLFHTGRINAASHTVGTTVVTNSTARYFGTINSTSNGSVLNATTLTIGNSTVNAIVNSTTFSGTANNTSYVGSVTAVNVVSNAQLSGNLANYQTTAGLSSNVATLTSNNTSFVGSVSAANVVSNAQLSGNLANYAALAGATFTGNVVANNANTTYDLNVGRNLTVAGNLTITGNVTVIGANNLSIVDNFLYLNSNNTTQNIDIGFAGNYNDGTYQHAGFFRDATDGYWKVFDGYLPEPDANVNIDTTNTSFNIAGMWIGASRIGNTSVYATINSTAYTGSANSASFIGTLSAANVVSNAQLSGNLANYQTTAGLSSNVATLTSNNTSFVGTVSAVNVVSNSQLSSNLASPPVIGSSTANGISLTYANVSGQINTATLYAATSANIASSMLANATGIYPTSNTIELGNTTSRWAIYGSSATISGLTIISTVAANLQVASQTTGSIILGGPTQTGSILLGQSTANQTVSIANGATISGNVKTISIGENGVAGSQTNITIGSSAGNTAVIVNANNTTFSGNINVGANVQFTTSTLFVGNTTVNSSVTSSLLQSANSTGNAQLVPTSLTVQNSTVNSVLGLQSLIIQSNSTVNGSITNALVQVANASGNVQHTATSILAQTNTTVNSSITASAVQVANSTGNVQHTATSLTVQNSTVNAVMGLQSLLIQSNTTVNGSITNALVQVANASGNVQVSATSVASRTNTTVNAVFSATTISIANATANVTAVPTSVTVQNSTVNSVMGLQSLIIQSNTTVNGSITNALVQVANSTGNVQVSATSVATQTNTTVNSTVSATSISVANSTGNASAVPTSVTVQNSTVNAVMGLQSLIIQSNTTVNGSITNTLMQVANSTGNVQVSATSILSQTNTTVNSAISATTMSVANSTGNAVVVPTSVTVQNSTVNTVVGLQGVVVQSNSTVNGSITNALVQVANASGNIQVSATSLLAQTNTTVNATVTSALVQVSNSTATANLTATLLNIYANSTVNGSLSSTTISVANSTGNVQAVPTSVTVQNSTVNAVMGLQSIVIQSNSTVNGSITNSLVQIANSTGNIQHTATSILAQTNTTVNSTLTSSLVQVSNSTATANLTATLLNIYANSTVNGSLSSTTVSVANSTGNATVVPTSLTIQNSTVNAVMGLQSLIIQSNTTVNGSITNALVQVANSTGNVQHTATSILAQTNTTVNATMSATSISVANSTATSTLNANGLSAGANVVANTTALRVGNTTFTTTNAVFGGTVAANGGLGSAGQVLTSGGAGNVYWSTVSGGSGTGAVFTSSSTAPSTPAIGDEWFDIDTGILYTYFNDGTSSQWVEMGPYSIQTPDPQIFNIDGGVPTSTYGGFTAIDAGGV